MTAPGGAPPPPTHIAGYRVERVLAVGPMGTVYLVQSPTLPRREALKVLPAELGADDHLRARFLHEADIIAGLEHPNIVRVFSRGETDAGQLWIAMEYVEGTNAEIALTDGQMTPERALHVITEVAHALDYAHSRGVVHQDIKPSNFLLAAGKLPAGTERVVLSDFGAALTTHSRDQGIDGPMTATLAYSAPEVITGEGLDERADVYSLGCTLYRMLAGEHFYLADAGGSATEQAHLDTTPPRLSDRLAWASPQLDSVIAKALARRPSDRYRSAGEFAAEVAGVFTPNAISPSTPGRPADLPRHRDQPPVPAGSDGAIEARGTAADFIDLLPHTRTASRRRELVLGGAVVGVIAVVAAIWLVAHNPSPPAVTSPPTPQPVETSTPEAIAELRQLLPRGYRADSCTPAPPDGNAAVITCTINTDPGGPRQATYTLAPNSEALGAELDQLVESTNVVICPENIQTPVLCPTGVSKPFGEVRR